MRIKVSNYIAGKLVEAGICQVFSSIGRGGRDIKKGEGVRGRVKFFYNYYKKEKKYRETLST